MSRYIDLLTLSEAIAGTHFPGRVPTDSSRWQVLPDDHWFWQPLPPGDQVRLVDGVLSLAKRVDERSIEVLRATAIAGINASADTALKPITDQYPRAEIDSWPEQCSEARAWLAAPSTTTPLLDAIAGNLGEPEMRVFCLLILSKAEEYKAAVGAVIAWRRVCTQWVEKQTDKVRLIGFNPRYSEVPDASQ